MSALEQIRKRPAITIGIVGFALILFLFTGINGCDRIMNRNYDTAATVDGHKIKINELNAATESMRNGGNYDNALLAQQALQDLINKALLNDAIEKAGIKVTDEEVSSLIYGADALPYFVQQANQYGFNTMDELYDFSVSGEPGSEQAKAIIDGIVNEVREGLAQQKFNTLLGAINVNKLDAQASFDASAVTSKITFARQDLNTIPDDAVVVSDDEIRTAYNKERERYAIPGKEVSADYISVRISPSDADYAAAQKEVEDAVVALGETSGTEAVADNYAFTVRTVTGTRESINDTQIKNNLDSIVKFGVRVLSTGNNNFAIAKLISQKT
ncbi:MAG: SurA N-terminal domain-containing protein, partial [Muribaculaceae bacterium]|nr:SurA N-terminal domain-containing protein [Muribaculaceae bacterium]